MKFGSLFSGVGGFDLGFERAGMECAWQVEIDKNCQNILKKHFPKVELYDDVRTIGKHNLATTNLICGGFPCQDLSIAGKRKGLAGSRSGLWFEFARIIDELEPMWVVIENVPGLLSSNKGADFAVILQWLAERGYGVAWRILDAQYFGVAQRRRRVFIVGSFRSGCAAEVLFEREGVRWDTPPRGTKGQENTTNAVSSIEKRSYEGINADNLDHMVINALQARDYKGVDNQFVSDKKLIVMAHGQANAEIINDKSPTLTINHEQPIIAFNLGMELNICWEMQHSSEVYRESGNVSPCLQARMGTGGNNVPMIGVRRLTPTECERLQGFPDGWTVGQSDSARYKQMGNAMAVPVAEWIGKRIIEQDKK